MPRQTLDREVTYTWKSAGGVVRNGCKINGDMYNGFCYTIEDQNGRTWSAFSSELPKEIKQEKNDE